jgi:hypothetical protein
MAVTIKIAVLWNVMPCSLISLFNPEDRGSRPLRKVGNDNNKVTYTRLEQLRGNIHNNVAHKITTITAPHRYSQG